MRQTPRKNTEEWKGFQGLRESALDLQVRGNFEFSLFRDRKEEMKMVKIISDSTCDLSEELLQKYEVLILPLHIILEETVV